MALAKADSLAQAVVDSLNASSGPLLGLLPAARKHAFEATLEEVARLNSADRLAPVINVIPRAERMVRASRTKFTHEYDLGVAIQSYCNFADTDRLDELCLLVEKICDHIKAAGSLASTSFVKIEISSLFDAQQLHERQQFFAMPMITYRIER